ncbi:MAG: DNA-3-methyladenine glycosylase I [Pseudomonadales bacterium]
MKTRCGWCVGDETMERYHDTEWGVPKFDRRDLFECLTLELMQTGLSWRIVLNKRAAMRELFFDFQPDEIARLGPERIQDWTEDPRIIRHRSKLQAMINNAQIASRMGPDFPHWLWSVVGGQTVINHYAAESDIPNQTGLSHELAALLRKEGFRFLGPIALQSFMQAAGMVDDHIVTCFRRADSSR